MRRVAYMFQDSRLLKRSIAENLRVAKPDATEAELLEVLRKAQCMEIVDRLPQGIHTVLGSQGTYLSGGEQQRVAIARAFLKDAPIILLDEASASLDVENETVIQEALSRLIRDKTVLVIAHRMRTVSGADQVVVLSEGRIAESGRPADLMGRNGLFARMVRAQTEGQQWAIGAENAR